MAPLSLVVLILSEPGTINKSMNKTIKFVAVMLCLTLFSLFYSCDTGTSAKKKEAIERQEKAEAIERKIFTADDFYNFAVNTPNWYEIDDVIQCMSEEKVKRIYSEYAFLIRYHNFNAGATCTKMFHLLASSILYFYISYDSDFDRWRYCDNMGDKTGSNLLLFVLANIGGDEACKEITHEFFDDMKVHGKLYKNTIIPVSEAYALNETKRSNFSNN